MSDARAFLKVERRERVNEPVAERLGHFGEFAKAMDEPDVRQQASRCMDCGVPFCHSACPVNNLIPDWNALAEKGEWRAALDRLHATNNFPEFTGRVCPAPCEAACTLNLVDQPVTIKTIECAIVDRGWDEGWIVPQVAARGTGKRVAVVGSGPAGLACAQQLARMGHAPTVFEKSDRIGGLLRYGIPDFKLAKDLIDRRVRQIEAEGVIFRTGMAIGSDVPTERIMDDYEVLVLAGGAEAPRDLPVEGRDSAGIHFAMDFLTEANRRQSGGTEAANPILATGLHVVVIGGGDTGSDCIGTSRRQGAASVTQIEILPEPPEREDKLLSWPRWPTKLRTSTSHEEGAVREFAMSTLRFDHRNGRVKALVCERDGEPVVLPADLVLLAMGFTGAPADSILAGLGATPDRDGYATDRRGVFVCGDMRRGQSLVVWAIREGRDCADAVDRWLSIQADSPVAQRLVTQGASRAF